MKRLRRSAEAAMDRLADLIEGDLTVRVSEFNGTFAMSPRSDLFRRIAIDGDYEPRLVAAFRDHIDPSRDVVDVGANIGFFSILAARLGTGRVLSAEPTPGAAKRLQANAIRNGVADRLIIYQGLVSDNADPQFIDVIDGREEYSSVGGIRHPSAISTESDRFLVPAATLDELVLEHGLKPGIIKVDVEGSEGRVFAGALQTLERWKPVVLSELSNALLRPLGFSGRDIVHQFESIGYHVVDPIDPQTPPGTRDFGDILCVPRDR